MTHQILAKNLILAKKNRKNIFGQYYKRKYSIKNIQILLVYLSIPFET